MGERYVVRFMRLNDHFPGLEYVLSLDEDVRATLLAYGRHFAQFGPLPGTSRGRWLRGKYRELYEFKPGQHRVFAFLDGHRLFVTNGAPKKNTKEQRNDYEVALSMRRDFFARV